jgi:carotenoid cleavage dioxygenase
MDRRELLRLAAASLATATVPFRPLLANADDWHASFQAALRERPWLLGWLGTRGAELAAASVPTTGTWPAGLRGTLYRNGPAVHELGGRRYHHWFDGDGMVQAFRIADGKVSHRGRVMETTKYRAEQAAGRRLRAAFGTIDPGTEPVSSSDSINPANISVLAHAGRLFALWEGGSPYEVDAATLATKGPYAWSEQTRGVPFCAHPRLDVDGTLWNIGYASREGILVIYRIDRGGALRAAVPLRPGPVPMVHDFVITERHLVVVLPPLTLEPDRGPSFLDVLGWRPDQPARVLIIDKSDLGWHRMVEMPAHFAFHYGNAWEEKNGAIRFDMARLPNPSVMFETLRHVMRGEWREAPWGQHHVVTVDPSGTVREERVAHQLLAGEFPFVDRRVAGRRYRKVTLIARQARSEAAHPYLNSLARIDLESGSVAVHAFGAHVLPEEHVFVPRPGGTSEDDGWLLGPGLDFKSGVTRLYAFDAARIEDGPIATATLPYAVPLGLHGAFVAG